MEGGLTVQFKMPTGSKISEVKKKLMEILKKMFADDDSLEGQQITLWTTKGAQMENGDDDAEAPPQRGNTKFSFSLNPPPPPKRKRRTFQPCVTPLTPPPVTQPRAHGGGDTESDTAEEEEWLKQIKAK